MTSILECMIEESQGLPHEVVDVVLAQFMRADPRAGGGLTKKSAQSSEADAVQTTIPLAQYSGAYNMAKNVANTCVDRMARYVSQYFTNVIMGASSPSTERPKKAKGRNARRGSSPADEDDTEEPSGPDEEGLKQLERAHRLLRELWKAAPGVLQNVIPQVEAELAVENVEIRIIATEAIGDMASGIGVAGPPPSLVMDPAMYPPMTLSTAASQASTWSGASLPSAPQSFSQTHPVTYASFISRRQDKSPLIRAAWATSIGRILSTSAGGIGLEAQEQRDLVGYLAEKVLDSDEKVRIAAVECVSQMRFLDIINVVCLTGGIGEAGSILYNIGLMTRDRKVAVRNEVFSFLGRLWGVASGEISGGNERIRTLFGGIPSVVFNAVYTSDLAIKQQTERVLYESFVPMGWPALKRSKPSSESQEISGSQSGGTISMEAQADKLRTERLLTLFRDLDARAKSVFISTVSQQRDIGDNVKVYLKKCEEYNVSRTVEHRPCRY
jgi:sister-chromatid-cohesion protein PDS5